MKLNRVKNMIIVLIMIVSNGMGFANATLISDLSARDWQSAGDNALTYDASTRLEWLDLSVTYGNSIIDTEAEDFFGEFRWASADEVANLLNSILFQEETVGNHSLDGMSRAVYFQSLLGQDYANYSQGISRGSPKDNVGTNIITYGLGFVQIHETRVRVLHPYTNCCALDTFSLDRVGSWLVRTATVPEPSTLFIFVVGLLGITARKIKQ